MANPVLFRIDEAVACWKRVTAPTLLVFGKDSNIPRRIKETPEQFAERTSAFANRREVEIDDCGHMMHHDQPERLAQMLEEFLA
jgi:pimeloyl-ACP methyl ester carboxylesterase